MSTEFADLAAARTTHLYRSAWLLCGDAHTAEDLVQETLEKVYVRLNRRLAPRIDNLAAYAQTTLVRTFISAGRRRSNSERPSAVDLQDGAGGVELGHRDGDTDLRIAVAAALAELNPVDRAVVVLRFFDDLSVSEVAAQLGLSAAAVRSRTHRALAGLRASLGPTLSDLLHS
jgi:RNA polymerase sigma-70 factor (sigma-E family)